MAKMTVEERREKIIELDEQMEKLRKQKQALAKEIDTAAATESAEARVAQMNDAERSALLQVLTASGIKPVSGVGQPGG